MVIVRNIVEYMVLMVSIILIVFSSVNVLSI